MQVRNVKSTWPFQTEKRRVLGIYELGASSLDMRKHMHFNQERCSVFRFGLMIVGVTGFRVSHRVLSCAGIDTHIIKMVNIVGRKETLNFIITHQQHQQHQQSQIIPVIGILNTLLIAILTANPPNFISVTTPPPFVPEPPPLAALISGPGTKGFFLIIL